MYKLVVGGLALAILAWPGRLPAQDKGKEIFKEEGKLTINDPRDTIFKKSFQKTHTVKLEAGPTVRIDLQSKDFDVYLRLEDPANKVVAQDDDSGGNLNARIYYKVEKAGVYKLVVTSYEPEKVGSYLLRVVEATDRDLLVLRARKLATTEKKDRIDLLADLKKYLTARGPAGDREDLALAADIARALERLAPDLAVDAYNDFGTLLGKSSDAAVARYSSGHLLGAVRRLKLPGQEMLVKGTTMDGKEFDWKAYRGKVVLVDFWATWCIPCRKELPNIRKMYEAYKDKGFDIVGVSVDYNRAALEKFLAKEKLPWVCLHEKDTKAGHPLTAYYGVMAYPLAVLVDRDGKVVSMQARGPELGRLLEKYMNAPKTPAK